MQTQRLLPRWTPVAFLLASLLSVPGQQARGGQWKAGGSLNITSGKYGTDTRTTVTQVPMTLDRYFDRARLGLTLPLISVRSAADVTIVNGQPRRTPGSRTTSQEVRRESGLGDILLRGYWTALKEQDLSPEVTFFSKIKFPTASRSRGLGTGEFDETIGADFWKTIRGPWAALAGAGYTFTGNPPGGALNDTWNYYWGAGYRFRQDLLVTAELAHARSVVPGGSNPMDLMFDMNYTGHSPLTLTSGLQFGLTDGSPDVGFYVGAAVRF